MNTTGDIYYEYTQKSLPFDAVAAEKTAYRNLHTGKSSSAGHKTSHGIDKVIAAFGGTVINDFNDDLIAYNVT